MIDEYPYFSICVPTRNRSETLFFCLQTLLVQNFESYEIIISDNSDVEESTKTCDILKSFNSAKIKYHKPGAILSMTANFEFALSKAKGKFIICLGDDDGLVINSLKYVYDFIVRYKATVVKCPTIVYHWPGSISFPDSRLAFPVDRPVSEINSKSILEKVSAFELAYFNLPMIYYAFVSRDIVDEVVREKGSFFHDSCSVDMYSGFIIAHKTEKYFITDFPFAIGGLSGKSNGEVAAKNVKNEIAREFTALQSMRSQFEKYNIPDLGILNFDVLVFLEFLRFRSHFGIDNELKVGNINLLVRLISNEGIFNNRVDLGLAEQFENNEIYKLALKHLREKFLQKQVFYPNVGQVNNLMFNRELINPHLFGIKNVYDVAVFGRKLIDGKKTIEPIEISNSSNYLDSNVGKYHLLAKKAINRLKKATKVLLYG